MPLIFRVESPPPFFCSLISGHPVYFCTLYNTCNKYVNRKSKYSFICNRIYRSTKICINYRITQSGCILQAPNYPIIPPVKKLQPSNYAGEAHSVRSDSRLHANRSLSLNYNIFKGGLELTMSAAGALAGIIMTLVQKRQFPRITQE